jgi:hypothetical protein
MLTVGNPDADRKFGPITVGLIAVRVVVVVVTVQVGSHRPFTDDLERFQQIAAARGSPYRTFPVEYMPGEVLFVEAAGAADPIALAVKVALVAFLADIATWAAVRSGWGARAAERYLWMGAPLLVFIYTRFDLVPVALAAWGAALVVRRAPRVGGVVFATAILSKIWPVVVAPAFFVARSLRAIAWTVGTVLVGIIAWIAYAGFDDVADVVTFRHASGWGVESTVGTVIWIVTGGPLRLEAGAPRIGSIPAWASAGLVVVLILLLCMVWIAADRRRRGAFGAASVAAVAALLICSPLISLQYAAWLLPWAAVAWVEEDRSLAAAVFGVEILTAVLFMVYAPDRAGVAQALLVARNGLLVALPVLWLLPERVPTRAAEA